MLPALTVTGPDHYRPEGQVVKLFVMDTLAGIAQDGILTQVVITNERGNASWADRSGASLWGGAETRKALP
jgi:hypothetical protein